MKKKTQEEFVNSARKVHGDRYDYPGIYINARTPTEILCKIHGSFWQRPFSHITMKAGCSECVGKKKKTTEQFIKEAQEVHGNRYGYFKVTCKNSYTEVEIVCFEHGSFFQLQGSHLSGQGCSECAGVKKKTTEQFIKEAQEVHGNEFDYSRTNYTNSSTRVEIGCKIHGYFLQFPSVHVWQKCGCLRCAEEKRGLNKRKPFEQFVKDSKLVHGELYDYTLSASDYKDAHTEVRIGCKIHGIFSQTPTTHTNLRCGCPNCNRSKGEAEVTRVLISLEEEYILQHKFKNCKDKRLLRFDVYLPKRHLCIEYDGEQHFRTVPKWFKKDASVQFKDIKHKDKIKNKFCKENNIRLLRIPYTEFKNIEQIIKNALAHI